MLSYKRYTKESLSDRSISIINYLILLVCAIIVLYPMIYIISCSFSSTQAVVSGKVWLFPVEPTLMGYEAVFKNPQIVNGYLNSIFYTVAGTFVNVLLTISAAYPLSRKDIAGRGFIMAFLTFTMIFNAGLIPTYLLIKDLHLIDSRWVMILPGAVSVWNLILARTYFQNNIPKELQEASEIDGCSDTIFMLRIVFPLSLPIIAVMTLFYAVGHWNSYFNALIYLKSEKYYPLQITLRNILILAEVSADMQTDVESMLRWQGLKDLIKYCVIVVASVPVFLLYPFIQRYFVKGIMVGAVKG